MKIIIKDKEVLKKLQELQKKTSTATRTAITKALDTLLYWSSKQVPLDEGILSKSGHAKVETDKSGYVAYNTDYAAFQHEGGDGTRRIKSWQNGRKMKYLEDPLNDNKKKLMEKIRQSFKQSMGL